MLAHIIVGLCFAVSDHLAEVFRLRLLETEKFNKRLDTFRGYVTLPLQDFHQETCVNVHSCSKDPVAECCVKRLFKLIEVMQEFAVVGVAVYVDFVSSEHNLPTPII